MQPPCGAILIMQFERKSDARTNVLDEPNGGNCNDHVWAQDCAGASCDGNNCQRAHRNCVRQGRIYWGVKRAVVPANGWYEWTGNKGRKTAWRIVPKAGGLLWFSAIYDVWTAATITCEPNADVRDIHHRMGALLHPSQIEPWLRGDDVPLEPITDGSLDVERADGVDWNGA